jgi:hypothetical protein
MDASIEFNQSAFEHGITEENIRYAFARAIFDHPLADDEDKNLLIGFDMSANVIEIISRVSWKTKIRNGKNRGAMNT